MSGRRELRSTASALRHNYPHLLQPGPSFHTLAAAEACDRLEAARQRALSPRRDARQLTLDLGR